MRVSGTKIDPKLWGILRKEAEPPTLGWLSGLVSMPGFQNFHWALGKKKIKEEKEPKRKKMIDPPSWSE